MDPNEENMVNKFFPFASSQSETFRVPNWAKQLLFQNYTLIKVKEIIKYYNAQGDFGRKPYLPYNNRVNHLLLDDIDLQSYSVFQIKDLLCSWVSDKYDIVELNLEIHGGEDGSIVTRQIQACLEMEIHTLKRMVLANTGNKPFFLEFDMSNGSSLGDLLKLQNGERNIKVFLNLDRFKTKVTGQDQGEVYVVEDIDSNFSIEQLMQKLEP